MESEDNSISGVWKKMIPLTLATAGLGAASLKTAIDNYASVGKLKSTLAKHVINLITPRQHREDEVQYNFSAT